MTDLGNLTSAPAEDVPPKEPPPIPGKSTRDTKLKKSLTKMYGTVGMVVFAMDQQCGSTVIENAEKMAEAMDEWAAENAAVRRVLMRVAEGSAVTKVIAVHAPVFISIATHHGPSLARLRPQPRDSVSTPANTDSDGEGDLTGAPVGEYIPPHIPTLDDEQ